MGDIFNITQNKLTVSGTTASTSVFAGRGILLRVVIDKSVDGAALTITDNDGSSTGINPDLNLAGTLAYGWEVDNGIKVAATDFTGGLLHIFYRKWDD